ncbi:MAG: hypothetical protein H7X74_00270 [Methyloceanibacter sp.]|nr:hypothetical protein [Methyloceanibacter sp.]
MLKVVAGILVVVAIAGIPWVLLAANEAPTSSSNQKASGGDSALAQSEAPPPASGPAPAEDANEPSGAASPGSTASAANGATPLETARKAEKGSLKSPYADYASVAEEGHKKYMAAGCNAVTAVVVVAAWVRPLPTRSGSMARTTTRCSA